MTLRTAHGVKDATAWAADGSVLRRAMEGLRASFSHTPRTLALVWRSAPRSTAALAALTLAGALLPLAIAWTGKAIVDSIVARDTARALRWVLVELGLVGAQAAAQRGLQLVRSLLAARLALDVNVLILEKALSLQLRHFEDPEFYDQLTRARREASSRPVSVVTRGFELVQNVLTLGGYVVLLVAFSGWAVLGLVLASVPATVAEMRFSAEAFRLRNWRSPDTRRLNYLEYVLANDAHAKEVKLFGLGPELLRRYRETGEKFYREDSALAVRRARWAWGLSLLGTAAFYGTYAAMALAAAAGRVTLGEVTLYLVAFRQGQQAFQTSLSAIGAMFEDNLYMSNLFAYLAIPAGDEAKSVPAVAALAERARATGTDGRVGGGETVSAEQGIRFDNVGFRYPGAERWVLRGFDLFVPRGRSLALVGRNGAGKTTLIKLLSRLYDPTEGRILLDGRDLRDFEPEALRRRIGVIFQDFNEYQMKLAENVGFGSVEHVGDAARLARAVAAGGADEVAAALPQGLETPLGRWFRDGVELSGGQWQKIALARAFMREEADILVLDEPTAALDAEAEHAVFQRFRTLAHGRTTLLISHRFSTVRMADRILVIEDGRIAEDGSHEELMAAGGRYARLFSLQAQGYA